MLQNMVHKSSFILFLFLLKFSFAYEIRVSWKNGTYPGREVFVDKISLLSLSSGMQEIAKAERVRKFYTFKNLPEPKEGPYMVQILYQNVSYSQVIPPNETSPVNVEMEIFEKSSSADILKLRVLTHLRYGEDNELYFRTIYYFFNNSKNTYLSPRGGVEIFLPQEAHNVQGLVSVGSGLSQIEWLKLTPQKIKEGLYLLPYPVKPGERLFEVSYQIPYANQEARWVFDSRYSLDAEAKLLVENEGVQIFVDGKVLKAKYEESLEKDIYDIPLKKEILFRGGKPLPKEKEREIFVKPSLNSLEKIFYSTFFLIFFIVFSFLVAKKPSFLQKLREKQKIRLEIEREYLQKIHADEKKIKEISQRIKNLETYLNS